MTATAGPAVLDALFAAAAAVLEPDVEVIDTYSRHPSNAAHLILGASDPDDRQSQPGLVSSQDLIEGFGTKRRESLSVRCVLVAPVEEPTLARRFLLSKLDDLDAALRADRSLLRLVNDVHLGPDFSLSTVDSPSGDECRYEFTIVAEAFI